LSLSYGASDRNHGRLIHRISDHSDQVRARENIPGVFIGPVDPEEGWERFSGTLVFRESGLASDWFRVSF